MDKNNVLITLNLKVNLFDLFSLNSNMAAICLLIGIHLVLSLIS